MRLRAHHLLCAFGFRGLGYSEDFVQNFQGVLQQIKSNRRLMIEVIDTTDDICLRCPHQKDLACQKDGQKSEVCVRQRDNAVIKRLDIEKDSVFPARKIFNLVKQNILPEDLAEICRDCQWLKYGYCVQGLREKILWG